MEQVAAVAARIAELRHKTLPAVPGFSQVLQRQLAPAPGVLAEPASPIASAASPTAAVALGQMFASAPVTPPVEVAAAGGVDVPAVAPAGGTLVMPAEGRVSSRFGMRVHPITGQQRMHSGMDIAAPTGTPVRAAAGGVVSFAGSRGGYGNTVIVDHPDGTQTLYAHKHTLGVQVGESVRAGQTIGTVGSTGQSTGPHLHFEVRRNGEPQDPAPLLGL
jgi:murein DD-endopeptidase MepM/ murein hydrolase activator NlpD